MTDEELLKRAIEFDAGPPVVFNGFLVPDEVNPSTLSPLSDHIRVVKRRDNPPGWAILLRSYCLSKWEEWVIEPQPTNRAEQFREATRWPTPQAAFEFLERWRKIEREQFLEEREGKE